MLTLLLSIGCGPATIDIGKDSTPGTTDQDDSGGGTCCDDTGVTDDSSTTPDDSDTTDDTDTTTDDTDTTIPGDWSCDNLPPQALDDNTLDEARAYHGIVFDDDANLIGWDGRNSLIKSRSDGTREVWLPGFSGLEYLDRFPDGDIVAADLAGSRLLRIAPDGATTTITSMQNLYGAGVVVGPDLQIYVATNGIMRVDPETGASTQIMAPPRGWTAHAINFNLDSTRLIVGSIGNGNVYYVDLDDDLNPISDFEVYAENVGGARSSYHDGVTLDACGNVYIPDYATSALYRIEPNGTVTSMTQERFDIYGHGVVWSPNAGGWRDDTIYQPQPYNGSTVREVVIGLPNGELERTWNGQAVPW